MVFCLGTEGSNSRSEEHTSELQSPVPISYAVFCLKKKKKTDAAPSRSNRTNRHIKTSEIDRVREHSTHSDPGLLTEQKTLCDWQ